MQTISHLAERLEMSAEEAVEKLRFMLFDVDGVDSPITDEQVDLLIDVDDDPDVATRIREEKQKEQEKKDKRTKRLQEAARKAAEKRKSIKKPKPGEAGEAEEAVEEPAGIEAEEDVFTEEEVPEEAHPAHAYAEILPEEPEPVEEAPAVKHKEESAFAIGGAVEHAEKKVEIVRADGTHLDVPELDETEAAAPEMAAEPEEEKGLLAEAERRQEEEERRRAKARTLPKPDPAVVAEVIRRAQERQARAAESRAPKKRPAADAPAASAPAGPAAPAGPLPQKSGLGKTARKKAKKAERMRAEETLRRNAEAAVREYQAAGAFGMGPKKRKKRRLRDEEGGEGYSDSDEIQIIEIEDTITVEALADAMDLPVTDLILDLMDLNILATKNQTLSFDVAKQVAEPRGYDVHSVIPEEEDLFVEEPDDPASLKPRAPVITVMGHVDHGKTSFLDYVRRANVAAGEVGGITQHIAAYDVETANGRVVFLDTPGHEAFTQMRARGAQVTDVVVLVVAADDGVMPQTIEAIDHAKAAEVPIVVAVNKCDKPEAEPDRIRQEMTRFELVDEAWGGKTIMKNISAKTGTGIDELMEMLVLEAEMLELKANPDRPARGAVIESEISRGQGPVAWVLVQKGTLRTGDVFICGKAYGRVRTMINARGDSLDSAGPSTPVCVTGFDSPPDAGDTFVVVKDERVARTLAEKRIEHEKQKAGAAARHITLEDFHARMLAGEKKNLHVVAKADVQGSVDVLTTSLMKLGNEEVRVEIVHSGVGGINESDVLLASASDAVILGFHVTANARVQKLAEQEGVDIRTFRIIYEAIEAVRKALEGMLAPEEKEVVTGHVSIRQVFRSSALGNIAGCYVTDGEVERSSKVRVLRDDVIVYEGRIGSLRRGRDDSKSVQTGFECGIKLENFEDVKEGDVIEAYRIEEVAKTLS